MVHRILVLGSILTLSACSLWPFGARPAGELPSLTEEAQELFEADRAFAARSVEVGAAQAFHEYLDDDGMQLPPNGEAVIGRDSVRARLAEGAAIRLSWEPRYAEVFESGNWGWTWGEWQAHEPGAGGRRVGEGKYVNLWKREGGRWKVRVDIGNVARSPSP